MFETLTSPPVVNSVGLLLDIIGVVKLFIYGLPAEISRSGADCLGFGKDPKEQAKARFYDRMAYVALVCLVSGFVLQGVSNWL